MNLYRCRVTNLRWVLVVGFFCLACGMGNRASQAQSPPSYNDVKTAAQSATRFYSISASIHGGYAYYYSEDMKRCWGEGEVDRDTAVVQPPGTPTVGLALLKFHQATREATALIAARAAAECLIQGQLKSGGWTQTIDFTPDRQSGDYRKRKGGRRNNSSLDDDQTQSALRFLIALDKATKYEDAELHEAVMFGLQSLLNAQLDCGAFPQVWHGDKVAAPARKASYPDYDWRTDNRIKNYWDYPTLNDGLAGTVCDTLIAADLAYGDPQYRIALERLGQFLIQSQMPDPQPAWAQQYNANIQPMWARKFEPPAITAGKSQDVIRTLMRIATYTGDARYLKPIPKALDYLENECTLADGRFARYYELRTNRPLFMNKDYQLTFDSGNAPTHYSWFWNSNLKSLKQSYAQLSKNLSSQPTNSLRPNAQKVDQIVRALDRQGRWVSTFQGERLVGQPKWPVGTRYMSSQTFAENLTTLAAYLDQNR